MQLSNIISERLAGVYVTSARLTVAAWDRGERFFTIVFAQPTVATRNKLRTPQQRFAPVRTRFRSRRSGSGERYVSRFWPDRQRGSFDGSTPQQPHVSTIEPAPARVAMFGIVAIVSMRSRANPHGNLTGLRTIHSPLRRTLLLRTCPHRQNRHRIRSHDSTRL